MVVGGDGWTDTAFYTDVRTNLKWIKKFVECIFSKILFFLVVVFATNKMEANLLPKKKVWTQLENNLIYWLNIIIFNLALETQNLGPESQNLVLAS